MPFGLVVGQLLSRYFLSDELYKQYFGFEDGIVEFLTPVVLLPVIFIGVMLMLNMRQCLPTRNSLIGLEVVTFGAF